MEDSKTNKRNGGGNGDAGSGGATPDAVEKFTGEKDVKKHQATKQTVVVTFRGNRKFALHVGRETVEFLARESKPIPKAWLKHGDFKQQQHNFVVKGVS